MHDFVGMNEFLNIEAKTKLYRSTIRPVGQKSGQILRQPKETFQRVEMDNSGNMNAG